MTGLRSPKADLQIDLAIRLTREGDAAQALRAISRLPSKLRPVRYWNVRANAERLSGRPDLAVKSYRRALDVDAHNPISLHGRARSALESGAREACDYYRDALRHQASDPTLIVGLVQAEEAEGRPDRALSLIEPLLGHPQVGRDALEIAARLCRLFDSSPGFARHYQTAVGRDPANAALWADWSRCLAGAGHHAEAANVALSGAQRTGNPHLLLQSAVCCGEAGEDARAGRCFAQLDLHSCERCLQEARHRLRLRDVRAGQALIGRALELETHNVAGWALRDLLWRLQGDPRHLWLHPLDCLVQQIPLSLTDRELGDTLAWLDDFHARSAVPLGQSVRHGTQTRGALFGHESPWAQLLRNRFAGAVEIYRKALPGPDEAHPLLRFRANRFVLAGSWSVKFSGHGHHVPHVHPQGIVSSALHLRCPSKAGVEGEGVLELGRSPPDLRLDLPPLLTIEPKPGYAVLFPSTLFHGTTAIAKGDRLSIAADLVPGHAK